MVTPYFFEKVLGNGAVDSLPEGYKLKKSGRTGLPILEKKSGYFGWF